jgi:NADH-quinone oxidoreductase subunit L
MGGLRKLMPVTAVTYFLSTAAIAGFPFFSGFFSKDEILWKAFDSGLVLLPGGGITLWALAALAALGTSFYMFRSYYLTFSGTYRGAAPTDHGHDAGHGHAPVESPRSITWVLATLALLAVAGGYVGLPLLWGLPNLFEHWLEPVFASSAGLVPSAGFGHGVEWGLMAFSVVVAFAGFGAARALYKDGVSTLPQRLLDSPNRWLRGVHRVVFHKYYVDEAYDASVVRPSLALSRGLALGDTRLLDGLVNLVGTIGRIFSALQGSIDRLFVDGLVNLVGGAVAAAGRALRRVQTGHVQAYVQGLALGALGLVVLAYLLAW